eukprot:6472597-Amphidinium_carterae.1
MLVHQNQVNAFKLPNRNDWTSETYASKETDNKVNIELLQARRVLLSTEAVNAGITLPQGEWVRRVYYDPRRELNVNVLATQTKSSAIQEGGRWPNLSRKTLDPHFI